MHYKNNAALHHMRKLVCNTLHTAVNLAVLQELQRPCGVQCDGEHKGRHQSTSLAQGHLSLRHRHQVCRPAVSEEHKVDQRLCGVFQQPVGGQHRPLHLPDVCPTYHAQQGPPGAALCTCPNYVPAALQLTEHSQHAVLTK